MEIASGGKAMRWRHVEPDEIHNVKFLTMYKRDQWKKALLACEEGCQPALNRLREKIFGASWAYYISHSITAQEFVDALLGTP
jgi:hypothetical protein